MKKSQFPIVFETIISNINAMRCDKDNTIKELLSTIEYQFELPRKAVQSRFINF